jgi:uncharacterized membrane protein
MRNFVQWNLEFKSVGSNSKFGAALRSISLFSVANGNLNSSETNAIGVRLRKLMAAAEEEAVVAPAAVAEEVDSVAETEAAAVIVVAAMTVVAVVLVVVDVVVVIAATTDSGHTNQPQISFIDPTRPRINQPHPHKNTYILI